MRERVTIPFMIKADFIARVQGAAHQRILRRATRHKAQVKLSLAQSNDCLE